MSENRAASRVPDWDDDTLDAISEISPPDVEAASSLWHTHAPDDFAALLDAEEADAEEI